MNSRLRRAFRIVVVALVACCIHSPPASGQSATITIHRDFEGLSKTTADDTDQIPPDPVIAACEDYIVTVVNRTIKIYDDEGAAVTGEQMDLDVLFNDLGEEFFDPKVVYDHYSKRFVLSCINTEGLLLMVAWSRAATDVDNFPDLDKWEFLEAQGNFNNDELECGQQSDFDGRIDHTGLGFDNEAWYVSCYLPNHDIHADYSVAAFYTIAKADGEQLIEPVFSNEFPGNECLGGFNPQGTEGPRPAEHAQQPMHEVDDGQGDVPTPYFVSVVRKDTGDQCNDEDFPHNTLRIYSIGDPLSQSYSLHTFDVATTDCFHARDPWRVPTSDTATSGLDWRGGDARITNAVYRQDGADEFLYVCHAVNDPVSLGGPEVDRSIVRWYKIDLNGWPEHDGGDPTIAASGEIIETAINTAVFAFLPTICVNDGQEMAIVYQRSSANSKVSMRAWGRLAGGAEVQGVLIKDSAVDDVLSTPSDLGHYTDIAIDPNGETFWVIGEYIVTTPGATPQPYWTTRIAEIEIKSN